MQDTHASLVVSKEGEHMLVLKGLSFVLVDKRDKSRKPALYPPGSTMSKRAIGTLRNVLAVPVQVTEPGE